MHDFVRRARSRSLHYRRNVPLLFSSDTPRVRVSARFDVRGSGADKFETLPHRIRCVGPWQASRVDLGHLKLHYRLQIAEQGFCVVYQHIASFAIER